MILHCNEWILYYSERCVKAGGPAGVFRDPCTNLLYKHKYKDLNNCLQSPEMFIYWVYTINTSYIIQEGVRRLVDQLGFFRDPHTTLARHLYKDENVQKVDGTDMGQNEWILGINKVDHLT